MAIPRKREAGDRWQDEAACRAVDPETFYLADSERGPMRQQRIDRAKAVCRRCPVINECLSWACRTDERYGVWGATTPEERQAIVTAAGQPFRRSVAG